MSRENPLRLVITANINPRLELDHLAEWFRHHATMGVKYFWLCSKHCETVSEEIDKQGQLNRNDQSDANHHLELKDREVNRLIKEIIAHSESMYGIEVAFLELDAFPREAACMRAFAINKAVDGTDWFVALDADELLVGDLTHLSEVPEEIVEVQIQQRMFESRWLHAKARPMAEVSQHYRTVAFDKKTISRLNPTEKWSRSHWIGPRNHAQPTAVAPSSRLRFHRFRGINVSQDPIKFQQQMPTVVRYSKLILQPTGDYSHQPEFDVILGTMRSGSSLLGHILSSLNWGRYAGETHVELANEQDVQRAIHKIDRKLNDPSSITLPTIEKIVHKRHWKDDDFLRRRVGRIYLLHRHPAVVWRSLKRTNWGYATLDYLVSHYRWLNEIVRNAAPDKIKAICYYDLVDPSRFERQFGAAKDSYVILPTTGKGGWGDPCNLIKTGKIQHRNERLEIQSALEHFDPVPSELQECINLYRKLVETLKSCSVSTRDRKL